MKKIISTILAITLLFAIGCASKSNQEEPKVIELYLNETVSIDDISLTVERGCFDHGYFFGDYYEDYRVKISIKSNNIKPTNYMFYDYKIINTENGVEYSTYNQYSSSGTLDYEEELTVTFVADIPTKYENCKFQMKTEFNNTDLIINLFEKD